MTGAAPVCLSLAVSGAIEVTIGGSRSFARKTLSDDAVSIASPIIGLLPDRLEAINVSRNVMRCQQRG
jgi:hypothetical protein